MKQQLMTMGLAAVLSAGVAYAAKAQAQVQAAQTDRAADNTADSQQDRGPVDGAEGEDRRRGQGRGEAGGRGEGQRGERLEGRPEGRSGGRPDNAEHGPPHGFGRGSGSSRDLIPLGVEDLEAAMIVLEEIQPDLARRLREIVEDDPDNAVRVLNERFPRVIEMLQLKRDDPQRFELHLRSMGVMRQMRPLMRAYREANSGGDEEAIAQARSDIREQIETLFDIRLELRLIEIQELRDRIAELEEQLETYDAQRDELIDQQIDAMTSGTGRLHGDWRGPPDARGEGDRPDRPQGDDRQRPGGPSGRGGGR